MTKHSITFKPLKTKKLNRKINENSIQIMPSIDILESTDALISHQTSTDLSTPSDRINNSTSIAVLSLPADTDQIAASSSETKTIRTTCPYCGVGCGVLASTDAVGQVSVQGDPEHPANFGKLCSKGSNLAQTLGIERRILKPYYQNKSLSMQLSRSLKPSATVSQQAKVRSLTSIADPSAMTLANPETSIMPITTETDWDTVLDDVALRLNDTIAKHGRDSVMFYVSGQLLTEDYYVANKFIKGFIGNNNIDSNSRLCMSSAVAGHKRAFGADVVPGNYSDFESCDLLVLVGSNMAWCHPILFGRFLKAKQDNPHKKLVVIDPRRTDSCEFADLHLPIAAGTDTHLYNGLLYYLENNGCRDEAYAAQCEGLDEAIAAANRWTIEKVAEATQVDAKAIEQFYQSVAAHDKTVTAFSMGVNQSSSGTDKVNSIINTHLLTGRVGVEGAGPFSLTGQPNAMGGREVGALANLLAAHLDLADDSHRQLVADFWQTPQAIAPNVGVKACDAADAILDGRIKAIWIMATNPVVSLPEADKFRRALAECDLVIVSECSKDSDTIQCADIVLPAQGWGEKSGTVTNSERRITRQRRLLPAAGEAKPDWWILSQVAKRMGLKGFDFDHPSEIFNEHVALTSYKNDDVYAVTSNAACNENNTDKAALNKSLSYPRHFNLARDLVASAVISNVNNATLSSQQYDTMPPLQWGGERINVMSDDYCHSTPKMIAIEPPLNAGVVNVYQPLETVCNANPTKPTQSIHSQHNPNSVEAKLASIDSLITDTPSQQSQPYDLRLITGRLRDQWHTMTRTGLAPKLNQQQTLPTLTLHPVDAEQVGVSDKSFVSISPKVAFAHLAGADLSAINMVMAQVEISDDMRVGDAFMPMHWSDAFASLARVGVVIATKVDPISAQPELKNSAICIRPVTMHTVGRILVHSDWLEAVLAQLRTLMIHFDIKDYITDSSLLDASLTNTSLTNISDDEIKCSDTFELPNIVWSLSRQEDSVLINIATPQTVMSEAWLTADFWQTFVAKIIEKSLDANNNIDNLHNFHNLHKNDIETSVTVDAAKQQLRLVICETASVNNDIYDADSQATKQLSSLRLAVYIAPSYEQLPSPHWLNTCFADMSEVPSVKWLLAGRPASGYVDPGPIVCACMGVGENIIIEAITSDNCVDALAVGKLCQAGTNCGSCVGQINDLIEEYA